MAEPIKYVQLDCHLDEKFEYIEAEFGLEGFAIIVKIFQRIYGGQGYYCEWSDRVALLFARKIGAGGNVVREVVSSALKEHVFDEEMYRKYGILTSHGIQKRFAEVAKRRAVIFDKPEYVIDSSAQISEDVCNSGSNVCNSGSNVCNQAPSKVKRSKVKRSEASAAPPPAPPTSLPTSKRDSLAAAFGEENVCEYERRFDDWLSNKGRNIRLDKYDTIAKWMKQDGVTKPQNTSSFEIDEVMGKIVDRYKAEGEGGKEAQEDGKANENINSWQSV